MTTPRFVVRKVELSMESEGPDYFTTGEFQVIDTTTGNVVARFPWSLDETYLTNANYSGPEEVRISEDEMEAIAREGRAETRVLLPTWNRPIDFDGVTIAPDTNFAELARTRDGQWLWKLYERLGSTPQAERLALAISALVPSEAALRFYEFVPDAPGFDAVIAAAERDASSRPRDDEVDIKDVRVRFEED